MINKEKKILITGASGFVGGNLVRSLVNQGFKNINIIVRETSNLWRLYDIKEKININYVSLLDIEKLNLYIFDLKPQIIFHLAAAGANIGRDSRGVIDIFEQNVLGTINLINACKEVGFEYFINTGSSSEYGQKDTPMKETDVLEPNNEYGITKSTTTMYSTFIGKKYNLSIYTFRLFSVYGYFEDKKRLIPTLIQNYLNLKSSNLSTPNSVRDYIFIDDVIEYYLNIDKLSGDFGGIYNIGNGIQYSIGEIVEKIKNISKSNINPVYGVESIKQNEPKLWVSDNKKATDIFGINHTSIDKGLEKTYNWFKNNLQFYK
ncbi:MAG: NAD(P)-dependent oxidoreductase [Candidatus Gracilibacteria bacterium]